MYDLQPKKLMIINILEILKKYTDADHRLSQKEIADLLKRDYNMTADRKSIKSNLMNLIDYGYRIYYSEIKRKGKNGEDMNVLTDWYLSHEFSDSELRFLIDSLIFSQHIQYDTKKRLISKLESLSSKYFKKKERHVYNMQESEAANKQFFYTIEILDEAIEKKRQVEFEYCSFDVDKKMHPRLNEDVSIRKYIVNPYQLAIKNGRYYLICNYDKYDDISNYRIDRIKNIRPLDTPARAPEETVGKKGLLLSQHISEHIYMFSGDTIRVKFRANRYIINDIIDYFGTSVEFSDVTENDLVVRVNVNEEDMFKWAVQFADHAVVLEPPSLKERIIQELKKAVSNYENL